jgi:hypothetical protein
MVTSGYIRQITSDLGDAIDEHTLHARDRCSCSLDKIQLMATAKHTTKWGKGKGEVR